MASEKAHKEKARHNQAFLDKIGDEFADWLVIVAFYKAVHVVEMLRALQGRHSRGHHQRNRYLQTEYPLMWTEFFPLWNFSVQARYDCKSLQARKVRSLLIGQRLPALERLVEEEMQKPRRRRR